jgi:hypothetical protein
MKALRPSSFHPPACSLLILQLRTGVPALPQARLPAEYTPALLRGWTRGLCVDVRSCKIFLQRPKPDRRCHLRTDALLPLDKLHAPCGGSR